MQAFLHGIATCCANLTRRLAAAPSGAPSAPAPGINRALRALEWAIALGAVLAGDIRFGPKRHTTPPPQHPIPPGPAPRPSRVRRPASTAGYTLTPAMRAAFRTRPIGHIVTAICGDLGIAKGAPSWPAALATLAVTPLEWISAPQITPDPPAARPLRPAQPPARPTWNGRHRLLATTARRVFAAFATGPDPPFRFA